MDSGQFSQGSLQTFFFLLTFGQNLIPDVLLYNKQWQLTLVRTIGKANVNTG